MVARALKIALVAFALAVGVAAAVAYFGGEPEELPFEYEGFD